MQAEKFSLDFSHLRTLTGDDNEFMIEILEMIVEQSPGVLKEMQNQLENQDFGPLGATAHKYKSSINILGNPNLIGLMKDIEDIATQSEEKNKLDTLVKEFEEVCDFLLDALNVELNKLQ
ncbi:MAG: Hpt domain-containing protein, partial [Bacteroidota bacterium]